MDYYERLKEEREEVVQRISKLSAFINLSPFYERLSTHHKRLLCLQLEFMKGYSFMLDLRIEDIERCDNNETDNN